MRIADAVEAVFDDQENDLAGIKLYLVIAARRVSISRVATQLAAFDQRRFSASSSSSVRGQSFPSNFDKARSASTLPPVWHLAQ
jgi:hypothetical protein